MLPLFVLVPARVVSTPTPETWLILPAPLMLFERLLDAVLPISKVDPLPMLTLPFPTEPVEPEMEIVPALIVVPPV